MRQIKQRDEIKFYMKNETKLSQKPQNDVRGQSLKCIKTQISVRRDTGTIHPDYSGIVHEKTTPR